MYVPQAASGQAGEAHAPGLHQWPVGQGGAQARQEAEAGPQGARVLKDLNLEELLASIDAALLATAERQKALGVADDDGKQLGQQVSSDAVVPVIGQGGPPFVGGDDLDDIQAWVDELMWDGAEPLPLNNASMMQAASGAIQYNNGNDVDMGSNHQCQAQTPPGNGENGYCSQLPWHAYQPNTTVSYPDHGFPCTGNNYGDMDEYSDMPVPSDANAYDGWYGQTWWGADESSCHAAVAFLPAAASYPSLDIAGNPAYMPPQHEHPSMGIGSLMDAGGHEYETGCLADYLQRPDASQHLETSRSRCITSVIWHKALAIMMISKQVAAALEELNSLFKVTAALRHSLVLVQSSPSQTWDISIRIQE
ncbi:unnamed protein product [Miscanthus lutarioriparius]|uniref:Uncharacterized protein n=1 Tax=Miscanthus lutarioriparius TaxID=422564 RepID=A0A811NVK6_9POAL|nr:unnamed protein product [Miscanthus lutarioriparius]